MKTKTEQGTATDLPTRLPLNTGTAGQGSYLSKETFHMERAQREAEQQGHRQLAKVHAREHYEQEQNTSEGELQNDIQQHPWLEESQRFDGISDNVSPKPPLNSAARREFDNQQREQEMEKQLRLGNMPKFSSTPEPKP